ncbi:hypothetical protein XU18_2765 [Perkinsela sp. CCAP 1560/4]|nr:hypothetical protein XU18_2765 [Perkinsela sp. CCAP 1560/4]|eukprot:KNH06260.1 hypothetical protein XU18_2765 [Perkinsela sp. CCAP 1560/4]
MTLVHCSKGLVSRFSNLFRTSLQTKSVKAVAKPKTTKLKTKNKPVVSDKLPKGISMQGEERVMMSHTTMENGKPVTKTFMKARKYHTDPKTGRIIEENITPSQKELAGNKAAGDKDLADMQSKLQESSTRFHDKLMQMQQDLRSLWRFPFY